MSVTPLKILTFNHHESYLCSLAASGHIFDVVTRYRDLDLSWNAASRPVPKNMHQVVFDGEVRRKLRDGYYDVVICHTVKNLWWLFRYWRPRYVFVAHIPLFFSTWRLGVKSLLKKALLRLFQATHRTEFFAVSEFKRQRWGESGEVAVLTPQTFLPPDPGIGYDKIIVVCNQLLDRSEELGYQLIQAVRQEFPVMIVGKNPGIDGAIEPSGFQEFVAIFRKARIYLFTVQYPFGDGYNTAMLEAMNMGMAIVTIANPSSPIKHGQNGLVAQDAKGLIESLRFLLQHPHEVDRLGAAAKKTIAEEFSEEKFLAAWQRVLGAKK